MISLQWMEIGVHGANCRAVVSRVVLESKRERGNVTSQHPSSTENFVQEVAMIVLNVSRHVSLQFLQEK